MSKSNTINVHPVIQNGIDALEKTRWLMNKMLEGLSDEQMMSRPCPAGNHTIWCIGHIALSDDLFLSMVSGTEAVLPSDWSDLFGQHSVPSDDATVYPSVSELILAMNERRESLIAWLSGVNEKEVHTPLPERLSGLAPTIAHLAPTAAFHEGVHAGQVSVCRRALGMSHII